MLSLQAPPGPCQPPSCCDSSIPSGNLHHGKGSVDTKNRGHQLWAPCLLLPQGVMPSGFGAVSSREAESGSCFSLGEYLLRSKQR